MLSILHPLPVIYAILAIVENLPGLKKGTYIIAVSGGIDSVSLLDRLRTQPGITLIVAHFDHGIRSDSQSDEKFVAETARAYNLKYVSERQELGAQASEALARKARYDFLRRMQKKYDARGIITAHHSDDVIETMIINLIRGTGWRGLCSLRNTPGLFRPLLAVSKSEIVAYAKGRNLSWREDETNSDQHYLRNAVRHQLMPKLDRQAWHELYKKQTELARLIDEEMDRHRSVSRYDYIMWPRTVALEMIKKTAGVTRAQAEYALHGLKTGAPGSAIMVGGNKKLTLTRDTFVVTPL